MPQYSTYGKPGVRDATQFGTGAGLTGGGEFAEYHNNKYAGDRTESGNSANARQGLLGAQQGAGAFSSATRNRIGTHRVMK